ncbi:hypothetical protein TD3509T_620001 [Tenacibaculum dicentrarchi]|uniref:Lipoprotein n=2 Tax=Tenacibaculum dicentrarchi TaxID=669041 RepID=A0ABM9NXR6_9FLAO|nr:hypothetical protein TD3509T_620001 [Tenacibaculum dicentrarchi]
MKKITVLLVGLTILFSCSKEDDSPKEITCMKSAEIYNNDNGAVLNLTSQKWNLKENGIGGVDVGVTIVGTIQGDSASIRTYGDGLIYDAKIELNNNKEFNQKFGIFFTSSPSSEEYVTANTIIMVFNGQDTLKANISSCSLENSQYQ